MCTDIGSGSPSRVAHQDVHRPGMRVCARVVYLCACAHVAEIALTNMIVGAYSRYLPWQQCLLKLGKTVSQCSRALLGRDHPTLVRSLPLPSVRCVCLLSWVLVEL